MCCSETIKRDICHIRFIVRQLPTVAGPLISPRRRLHRLYEPEANIALSSPSRRPKPIILYEPEAKTHYSIIPVLRRRIFDIPSFSASGG
jgi:hypothetical protein